MTDEEKKQATPEEKQRDIPTPENWHWKITPEDIEKIKANDRDTINRVYFDNLPKFAKVARGYIWRSRAVGRYIDFGYVQDIINEIYLRLPLCSFVNVQHFYYSLLNICRFAVYGKVSRCKIALSLDEDFAKNEKSEGFETYESRLLTASYVNEMNLELEDNEKKILCAIGNQKQLTAKQKDFLTAYVLHVRPYDGIFDYEYKVAFGEAG